MIDVSQIVAAPELGQEFTIQRSTGSWLNGVWVSATNEVDSFGVISVASAKDIVMTPEGDEIKGEMVFHSEQPIYTTSAEYGRSSDILIWRDQLYRVLSVKQYVDYGYYRAVATRMKAAG